MTEKRKVIVDGQEFEVEVGGRRSAPCARSGLKVGVDLCHTATGRLKI